MKDPLGKANKLQRQAHRVIFEIFPLIAGQLLGTVASLVAVKVLTNLLTPDQYGRLGLGLTFQIVANQIIFGPLGNSCLRFAAEAKLQNTYSCFLKALLSIYERASLAIATVGFLIILLVRDKLGISSDLAFYTVVPFTILSGGIHILGQLMNAQRHRIQYSLLISLDAWCRYAFGVAVIIVFAKNAGNVLLGFTIGSFVSVIAFAVIQKPSDLFRMGTNAIAGLTPANSDQLWRSRLINYSFYLSGWGAFTWIQLISDRWSLQIFAGSNEVGIFSVAYQLGYTPIALICGLGMQTLAPILFARKNQLLTDQNTFASMSLLDLVSLCAVFAGFFGFLASIIIKVMLPFLSGSAYSNASILIAPLSMGAGFFSGGEFLTMIGLAELRMLTLARVKIMVAFSGVGLNVIGARWLGAEGVAWAIMINSLIYLLILGSLEYKNRS